ncbi:MAG: hypothetical protein J6T70_11830, partial [Bacteroidales bacterium]|nr:hypothetical protein [Bacteroidales bacterium]
MENDKTRNNKLNTIRWKVVMSASIAAILLCAAVLFVFHKVVDQKLSDYSRQKSNITTDKYTVFFEKQLNTTIFNLNAQANALSALIQQTG